MRYAAAIATAVLLQGCVMTPEEMLKDGATREVRSAQPARVSALCVSRNAEEMVGRVMLRRLSEAKLPGHHELVLSDYFEGGFMVFRFVPVDSGSSIRMYSPHWPYLHYDARFKELTAGC